MRLICASALAAVFLAVTVSFGSVPADVAQQPTGVRSQVSLQVSGDLLDINTATLDQLKSLSGMGGAYARRVIAGRPYTAKNQLVTRGVLPQTAYDAIQNKIVARHRKE
jgi:competence protein ComEA